MKVLVEAGIVGWKERSQIEGSMYGRQNGRRCIYLPKPIQWTLENGEIERDPKIKLNSS